MCFNVQINPKFDNKPNIKGFLSAIYSIIKLKVLFICLRPKACLKKQFFVHFILWVYFEFTSFGVSWLADSAVRWRIFTTGVTDNPIPPPPRHHLPRAWEIYRKSIHEIPNVYSGYIFRRFLMPLVSGGIMWYRCTTYGRYVKCLGKAKKAWLLLLGIFSHMNSFIWYFKGRSPC